jgi:prevent-host-death family protein
MPVATSSAFHYYLGMDEAISAAEANRAFSRLLREVREEGRTFVVTSHGKPVAKLVPCTSAEAGREAARTSLLARLAREPAQDVGRWNRDELYER